MKQVKCRGELKYRGDVILLMLLMAMGCEYTTSTSTENFAQPKTAKPTDVHPPRNIGPKNALVRSDSRAISPVADPCVLDQRGLIEIAPEPMRVKERRLAAWQREFDIQSPKALQNLLPVFGDSQTFALVSAELSFGISGGRPFDGGCIRFRYLTLEQPKKTVARLLNQHNFVLLEKSSGNTTELSSKERRLRVSVGTNENLTTQLDGVIRLRRSKNLRVEQLIDEASVSFAKAQLAQGIEYGIYSSGRRGLKFAGLERMTWRTRQTLEETIAHIERAGFSRIKDHLSVWKKQNETYTFRTYEAGNLSIFWQKKWTHKDWASRFSRSLTPVASPLATPKPLKQSVNE